MDLKLAGKPLSSPDRPPASASPSPKSFASEGAHVIVNGRTQSARRRRPRLHPTPETTPTSTAFAADFSSAAGAEPSSLDFPTLDILVNNVGIFESNPLTKSPTPTGSASSRSTS